MPVTPQCALLQLSRAAVYRKPKPVSAADLELMRLIDEQYLKTPFYGVRKMAVVLSRSGHRVGRKRVIRLAVCCCCCRCEHVATQAMPRFESSRPSQPVRSLRCDFQVWENRRHSRGLAGNGVRGAKLVAPV